MRRRPAQAAPPPVWTKCDTLVASFRRPKRGKCDTLVAFSRPISAPGTRPKRRAGKAKNAPFQPPEIRPKSRPSKPRFPVPQGGVWETSKRGVQGVEKRPFGGSKIRLSGVKISPCGSPKNDFRDAFLPDFGAKNDRRTLGGEAAKGWERG